MNIERIKNFLISKSFLIIIISLNTYLLWQISYYTFILWNKQFFFDSNSYISMAKGDFNVVAHHGYRIGMPLLASLLANFISILKLEFFANNLINYEINLRLSFYLINLIFSSFIFYFLYEYLRYFKFSKIAICLSIFSIQFSSVYLFYISVPNVDIAVIFFMSLSLYGFSKFKKLRKFFIFTLLIGLIGTLFKEYIFLINLSSLIIFLKNENLKIYKKIIICLIYLILNIIFIVFLRQFIQNISINIFNSQLIDTASLRVNYLLGSIFSLPLNLKKLQDIMQFSPIIIILILFLGEFRKRKIFNTNNNYGLRNTKFYSEILIFQFLIFMSLSGAATWSLRIFFPFFINLLPKICESIELICHRKTT